MKYLLAFVASVLLVFSANAEIDPDHNVVQREYIFHGFVPYTATVYLKDPTTAPNNWSSIYIYAWDSDGVIDSVIHEDGHYHCSWAQPAETADTSRLAQRGQLDLRDYT